MEGKSYFWSPSFHYLGASGSSSMSNLFKLMMPFNLVGLGLTCLYLADYVNPFSYLSAGKSGFVEVAY